VDVLLGQRDQHRSQMRRHGALAGADQQVALARQPPGQIHRAAGTERTPLLTLNEVCVLPQGHPLAQKDLLTPRDFNGENYISLSRTDSYRQLLDALFSEHDVKRRMVMETHSAASVCAMVRAGAGISVVNPLTALDYAASGVVVRRFSIEVPFTVSLIRPVHRPASALVDAFCEHLQRNQNLYTTPLEALLTPR